MYKHSVVKKVREEKFEGEEKNNIHNVQRRQFFSYLKLAASYRPKLWNILPLGSMQTEMT